MRFKGKAENVGLDKRFIQRFHNILREKLNKHLGHPNTSWKKDKRFLWTGGRHLIFKKSLNSCGESMYRADFKTVDSTGSS